MLKEKTEYIEINFQFIDETRKSIMRIAQNSIKNGDDSVLKLFKFLIPDIYQLFEKYKDTDQRLWKKRAEIERIYIYVVSQLDEYKDKLPKDKMLRMQLTFHEAMGNWLKIAIERKDYSLAKELSGYIKQLVFSDNKMQLKPEKLVAYHFILCGRWLKTVIDSENPQPEMKKVIKSLIAGTSGKTPDGFTFNELAEFYLKHRPDVPNYSLDDIDWVEEEPMSGFAIGKGGLSFDEIYFDYTFVLLALITIDNHAEPLPTTEFIFVSDKIDKYETVFRDFGRNGFEKRKEQLKNWIEGCKREYEKERKQHIEEAKLDEKCKANFMKSFIEGYSKIETFVKYCIRKGYYQINKDAQKAMSFSFYASKILFIDGYDNSNYGKQKGKQIARGYDNDILRQLIGATAEKVDSKDIVTAMNEAVGWLQQNGVDENSGIIIYEGLDPIDALLFNEDDYIPPWQSEGQSFSGYYKNYPIVELGSRDATIMRCYALNLCKWQGIEIAATDINKLATISDIAEAEQDKAKCKIHGELHYKLPDALKQENVKCWEIKNNEENTSG